MESKEFKTIINEFIKDNDIKVTNDNIDIVMTTAIEQAPKAVRGDENTNMATLRIGMTGAMTLLELSEKIVSFRAKHGLSIQRFADMCGISYPSLCNIENCKAKPSRVTVNKILKVLARTDTIAKNEEQGNGTM